MFATGLVELLMKILKALVVDDDELKRILLVEIAELCGLETSGTDCGEKASELIKEEDFDVVLLDYFLKDCTGDTVLEEILANHTNGMLPYFVLSSSDMDKCRLYEELGFNDCFEPPFDLRVFERLVEKLKRDQ